MSFLPQRSFRPQHPSANPAGRLEAVSAAPSAATDQADFSVVFVCTGNRFRSPIAAGFFSAFTNQPCLHVSSMGTLDVGSKPPLPEALKSARELGIDIAAHRAAAVRLGALAATDLVIGFERIHCATGIVEGKADARRTFTLVEAVELLESLEMEEAVVGVERARLAIARADGIRRSRSGATRARELRDPFGQSRRAYRRTAEELRDLSLALADHLFRCASSCDEPRRGYAEAAPR